ncbi:hypothetical protein EV356DRAFT_171391 [Viridothelium virens]|uniref:Uncharacterized protein n=1 Tax=Viridothelium virens TaxID=1048519 RepID=A0A6A6HMZ4_VIRVR|nr:hypothetical protein EV356DRAFT_171391 [Viridothelium virens]
MRILLEISVIRYLISCFLLVSCLSHVQKPSLLPQRLSDSQSAKSLYNQLRLLSRYFSLSLSETMILIYIFCLVFAVLAGLAFDEVYIFDLSFHIALCQPRRSPCASAPRHVEQTPTALVPQATLCPTLLSKGRQDQ